MGICCSSVSSPISHSIKPYTEVFSHTVNQVAAASTVIAATAAPPDTAGTVIAKRTGAAIAVIHLIPNIGSKILALHSARISVVIAATHAIGGEVCTGLLDVWWRVTADEVVYPPQVILPVPGPIITQPGPILPPFVPYGGPSYASYPPQQPFVGVPYPVGIPFASPSIPPPNLPRYHSDPQYTLRPQVVDNYSGSSGQRRRESERAHEDQTQRVAHHQRHRHSYETPQRSSSQNGRLETYREPTREGAHHQYHHHEHRRSASPQALHRPSVRPREGDGQGHSDDPSSSDRETPDRQPRRQRSHSFQ